MNCKIKNKTGMAIVVSLVFASVLLYFVVSYSGMLRQSSPQTIQIDERIKLDYYARGLCELALLKFQMFPAYFFAACDAAEHGYRGPLNDFVHSEPEFTRTESGSQSSFNATPVSLQIASMAVITEAKYEDAALYISAEANYTDRLNRPISKEAVRIVAIDRRRLQIR